MIEVQFKSSSLHIKMFRPQRLVIYIKLTITKNWPKCNVLYAKSFSPIFIHSFLLQLFRFLIVLSFILFFCFPHHLLPITFYSIIPAVNYSEYVIGKKIVSVYFPIYEQKICCWQNKCVLYVCLQFIKQEEHQYE